MLRLIKQKMGILSSVSLNTGSLDHTKESHEEAGVAKITTYFQKLAESENGENVEKRNVFKAGEVITVEDDDEWLDDEIFCLPDTVETSKKRVSDGSDDQIPAKKSK